MAETELFIGGKFVPSDKGETFETRNPATWEPIASVHRADEVDVERAIAAAQAGLAEWKSKSGAERGRVLIRAAERLRARNEEIARVEVADTGKPIAEALTVDVHSGADCLEYYGGLASKLHGHHYQLPGEAFAYTRREPLGICAGIGAWNYPLQIACWKTAPALACGNAMIFKPSELTPLSANILAEVLTEAGLPDGLFNVLQGDARTGRLLSRHPTIAKISLTGEAGTGKKVMADAASSLKVVTMELGGKSPLLIFDDAEIDQAVEGTIAANFFTQGEICTNGTRVFVQRRILPQLIERLLPRVASLRVGDPMNMETQVGALISPDHAAKVEGYVQSAIAEGAKLLAGGTRDGSFFSPTVFDDCHDEMTIVREEVFGPVMTLLPFNDEAEAIERANRTEFGLASGLFTQDVKRAHRVAAELEAQTCWINNYNVAPIEMPFGGFKQSGLGYENSLIAVESYSRLKTVYVELGSLT